MLTSILNNKYFNNTLFDYISALGIILAGIIIIKIINAVLIKKFRAAALNTENNLDDFLIANISRSILPIIYISLFYYSVNNFLKMSQGLNKIIHLIFIVTATLFGIRLMTSVIKFSITSYMEKRGEKEAEDISKSLRGISSLITIIAWTIGIVFLLDNLGFKISAVVAGLGIGGIAVALASQTILRDLFSYFVIFFDRPFQIGDFIIVDNKMGSIEKIGIKTTRIKSLTGEQLVMSNTDLTNARIHNYKKMEMRRVEFSIGITYQASVEQVKSVPVIIREIVESQEGSVFDRAHFKNYGDSSLNFEIVYMVQGADYNVYMDIQQSINLAIFEEFARRGIEFAYPTRTLFMEKS